MNLKNKSLKFHLVLYMVIFVFITLILLWLFQVVFLEKFYLTIKKSKIDNIAGNIEIVLKNSSSSDLTSSSISNYITRTAITNDVSIIVTDKNGNVYTGTETSSDQLVSRVMAIDEFAQIFNKSQQNIKKPQYLSIFSYDLFHLSNGNSKNNSLENVNKPPLDDNIGKGQNIIYVNTVLNKDKTPATLIVLMKITLLNTTVENLRAQLIYVTIIMMFIALFTAFFIAKKVARPIENITKAAKNLGKENYNYDLKVPAIKEVKNLNDTLHFVDKKLKKTEATRKEFLANISHDLRTPLTMIKGYSEVIRDIPGENNTENIQVIIDETIRLQTLVNDLLELSKLEENKDSALKIGKFDLTCSIQNIVERFKAMLSVKGYDFIFENMGVVMVSGDELKISQVIYNLINNAVTYTGEDKMIKVREKLIGSKVRVEVEDTGSGIDMDKIADIWDRYYKIESSHKRPEVGSGLGLSIVKSIIDLHAGKVGAESSEKGSVFWFELLLLKNI